MVSGMFTFDDKRVCASCGWFFCVSYGLDGCSCPRCNFGSYGLSFASNPEERIMYTSQQFWKERSHLPDEICNWIIDVHHKSMALENL